MFGWKKRKAEASNGTPPAGGRTYLNKSDYADPVSAVHSDASANQRKGLHDVERIYLKVYGLVSAGGFDSYFTNTCYGEPETDNCISELREFGRDDLADLVEVAMPVYLAHRRSDNRDDQAAIDAFVNALGPLDRRLYKLGEGSGVYTALEEFVLKNYPWGGGLRP